MWIQHFLCARTARLELDGILTTKKKKKKKRKKKVYLPEGVPQGGGLSPTLLLAYSNDILTTVTKRVSTALLAEDLVTWNASDHTNTATYRIQEAINGINKSTLD